MLLRIIISCARPARLPRFAFAALAFFSMSAAFGSSGFAPGGGCLPGYHAVHSCYPDSPCSMGCAMNDIPVYVDPRIAQAAAVNESGRASYQSGAYEEALALFNQAFSIYPDPVYSENADLARNRMRRELAHSHFERGQELFEAKNWSAAIAEYERAMRIDSDFSDSATHNIEVARSNQAWGGYREALAAKQFDTAVMYLQEANKWLPDEMMPDYIREVREQQYQTLGHQALDDKNYADALAAFNKALAYAPDSAHLHNMRALCLGHIAIEHASTGSSVADTVREFDQVFSAFDAAVKLDTTGSSASNRRWAHGQARYILSKIAASPADWAEVIAAHKRWADEAGAEDTGAQAAFATTLAAHAHKLSGTGNGATAESINETANAYSAAVAADPNNLNTQKGQAWAAAQQGKLEASQHIAKSLLAPGSESRSTAHSALDQARDAEATVHTDPSSNCPWDSGAGCVPGAALGAVNATEGGVQLSPAERDTPAQHEIRTQYLAKNDEVQDLGKKLDAAKDPMEKALIKAKLRQGEYELHLVTAKATEVGVVLTVGRRKGHGAAQGAAPATTGAASDNP